MSEALAFASRWLAAEKEAGRRHGPTLLGMATGLWRSEMARDANLRRYGTLLFVLEEVRRALYLSPLQARERAAVVIEFAEYVVVPDREESSNHYRTVLAGTAWKDYGNALKLCGDLTPALAAAKHAYEIFSRVGSLACDAAKARLLEALILRELGHLDEVLTIVKECEPTFREFGDSTAYMQACMTRALVLSDSKRYADAMAVLATTAADAEARSDTRTLAICLHNTAECARALGDRETARRLDARALNLFEQLGTAIEKPRIRGTEGLALADEGKTGQAILQLRIARADFLELGMNGSAADCGLAIVRLRFDSGEDVTSDCIELIETFSRAGVVQPALEALAYLREQSRSKNISAEQIEFVRQFVRDSLKGPVRMFLPPPNATEDGG